MFYRLPGPWPEEPFTLYRCNLYLASKHKSSGRLEVRPGSPPAKISLRSVWLCVAAGGSRSARWRVPVFVVPVWVWQTDDVTLEGRSEPTSGSTVIRSQHSTGLTEELGSCCFMSHSLTDANYSTRPSLTGFFFPRQLDSCFKWHHFYRFSLQAGDHFAWRPFIQDNIKYKLSALASQVTLDNTFFLRRSQNQD